MATRPRRPDALTAALQPGARTPKSLPRVATALLALLAWLAAGSAPERPALATAAPQSLGIALKQVVQGLSSPVAIAQAGDGSGRLFVVEQPGRIKVFTGTQLLVTPFLDITALVNSSGSEQGLLGLAFDPDYATNGFFYVDYTGKSGIGDTVVARYKVSADPNVADPASVALLSIVQPEVNHNGGQLQFGPDHDLYISTGDGGGGGDQHGAIGNAQNLGTLLGKILRIDVRNNNTADGLPYDIPPDNPFVNRPGARKEIWAYGLRNPWRFSFDRQTGDMLIGDVGQNIEEELDFQPAGVGGENYGWRCKEGNRNFTSDSHCATETFTNPILVYDHVQSACAVTGGYRYRGARYPALQSVYFYADYCNGQIWGATQSGAAWSTTPLLDTAFSISTFGEDQAGELYVADRGGGRLYHMVAVDTRLVYLPAIRG